MSLPPGTRLGPYEILAVAGAGGMAEVYRARDTRLHRIVAIKILPEELLQDPARRQRLEREARSVSGLSHPHICTLYDVGRQDGVDYLVMEYLEGETLADRLQKGPLPLDQVMRCALEIAAALESAHRRGIIHRDLKPGNVMSTPAGAKLLDFGLARMSQDPADRPDASAAPTMTRDPETRAGSVLGTPAYMSPEQAQGKPTDARTDVFAFGLLLYEMITGRRVFVGDSAAQLIAAVLRDDPPPIRALRPEAGEDLERILRRCLAKDPAGRYSDGAALLADLRASEARRRAPATGRSFLRRMQLVVVALGLATTLLFSLWTWWRAEREREIRRAALTEILRLVDSGQLVAAFHRAREVQPLLARDPEFERLWRDASVPFSLDTDPPGADVSFKDYDHPEAKWERLGVTPVRSSRAPPGQLRFRLAKEGYETAELAGMALRLPPSIRLVRKDLGPAGMVFVPGGEEQYQGAESVPTDDYFLDRFEVTNREFKQFVDRGGYENRDYWKEPFQKAGRELSFAEAMALFRDSTGRMGPSTWELGTYPEGQGDFPVAGVSWYEACAYARFAGKSLPTFHHWFRAAGAEDPSSGILSLSNFGGKGAARVGSHQGTSPWGNHDMAGNVREWVWNAAGSSRYTLGGAWSDPTYLFTGPDALDPFDRSPIQGFRCALYSKPPAREAFGPIETVFRDYSKEKPVGDEIFAAYRDLHRYDPGPLESRTESLDDASEYWKEEQVSFAAAYGGERIPATLFLPKNAAPPFQAVLYFPPGSALRLHSIHDAGSRQFAFLVRGGRAVLFPGYKGTYERRQPPGMKGSNTSRDTGIQWSKDVGRSLDYLDSRPDIDPRRLAFYGLSMGAEFGPIVGAVEPRLRALVLVGGGLSSEKKPPEVDPFNFASRVRVPVLMINGNHDFIFPLEESQKPLFGLFMLPESQKRHCVLEGGHVPPRPQEIARETLDWLDRTLGPVRTKRP